MPPVALPVRFPEPSVQTFPAAVIEAVKVSGAVICAVAFAVATVVERVDSYSLEVVERHFVWLAVAAVVEEHMFAGAKK